MLNLFLADLIVAIHFGFILFVVLGGLPAMKWPRLAWLHLPAAVWGALIEFTGWICPLTVIENKLRAVSGSGYSSSFIEHYLIPIIYPSALTREIQMGLGLTVVLINLLIYRQYYIKWIKRKPKLF
jgi:hypothetical protein